MDIFLKFVLGGVLSVVLVFFVIFLVVELPEIIRPMTDYWISCLTLHFNKKIDEKYRKEKSL